MKSTTFTTYVFGCRVNHAENEIICNTLYHNNFKQVQHNPDIAIINSCAITNNALRSMRQLINRIKRENPKTYIVLTGCGGTYHMLYEKEKLPVDLILDNANKQYLADIITCKFGFQKSKNQKTTHNQYDKFLQSKRLVIKISDGCNRFCSYCIVPYLRGLPKSTSIKTIINTINQFPNTIEVILTAINTDCFGSDTNETLIQLIDAILTDTNIKRISFGSIHPWSITDEFLNYYKKPKVQEKLVHFFHIPVQSGSDYVLNIMKRGYTKADIVQKINKLYDINPYAFFSTDIIVGFLSENELYFNETNQFLQTSPFSKFHVFPYSLRNHTAGYYLKNKYHHPSPEIKKERSYILRTLSKQKEQSFYTNLVGYSSSAIVLSNNKNSSMALLNNQVEVEIKNTAFTAGTYLRSVYVLHYKDKLIAKVKSI